MILVKNIIYIRYTTKDCVITTNLNYNFLKLQKLSFNSFH